MDLLKVASSALNMGPQHAMQTAERLYTRHIPPGPISSRAAACPVEQHGPALCSPWTSPEQQPAEYAAEVRQHVQEA